MFVELLLEIERSVIESISMFIKFMELSPNISPAVHFNKIVHFPSLNVEGSLSSGSQ